MGLGFLTCCMAQEGIWSKSKYLTPAYHFFLLKQQQVSMNEPGMLFCKVKKQPQGLYHRTPGPLSPKYTLGGMQ